MRRFTGIATAGLLLALLPSAKAEAHARLVAASPRESGLLAAAPAQLDLWFDEVLDEGFHEVTVVPVDEAPAKARNRAGVVAVDPDDRTHLSVPLERLPNGAWAVRWRVLSRDGRGARGRFEFRVIRDRDGAY